MTDETSEIESSKKAVEANESTPEPGVARDGDKPTKTIVDTGEAPRAIGPYSQAVAVGNLLFISGQIALSPKTGDMVALGVKAQTEQVMKNLGAILAAVGLTYEHLVKTTIYLRDMEDFAVVNEIYGGYFDTAPPARATIEVSRLPKGAKVEIDGIAVLPK
ncbi:MAG: hypothetical protein CO108_06270 [Deltaproteobacteria bacterium CG_4_9_14_3_um_filter_63_12]|nr:MAG: hypothetical protein COW42_14405 [Deltaproteobacteria bacterium CG17_big_fil_post_rev_8_21_14_2_50_63_7]PJB46107.1 MAG: hypothetical protein CO108_06270 [Deltaproteobacteria bacterium CG_4_9_14_3_um_filter_63_12]